MNKESKIYIEKLLEELSLENLTIDEIAKKLNNMCESTITFICLYLIENKKKELALKVEKANKVACLNKINEFKNAVLNGIEEEYLSDMLYIDKIFLEINMGISRLDITNGKKLTKEEQKYYDILEKSIRKDLLLQAKDAGFSDIESWQKHNNILLKDNEEAKVYSKVKSEV